ncbi:MULTISPECIES: 2OG-Fe(II) oxygenase [unclassified Stenotrophomonas]|uniref:2OG-Fe(II) oxygenase n=1 Tax=unclassified Stenotrophomonas TaxID=196198 RepID=UPI0024B5B0B4|nr:MULTISPECIES: 2OG-Fe(II) oxygenase [unclassified Stenotrophomonas]MDI9248307.1 2OG-Fe(II) oxygenase [Stenotrophomonas sp. RS-48]MDI9271797.1 2OG-Fe(II) oxygenase [Stenotrophomonas sp. PFBMAA-4]
MSVLATTIEALDWEEIARQLDGEGYALLPGLLLPDLPSIEEGTDEGWVSLTSVDMGRGKLYYYADDMPEPLGTLRQSLYPHLAAIANSWNQVLGVDDRYPLTLKAFQQRQREVGQVRGQSHLSQLGESDYLALHQRAEDELIFPLQLIGLLSAPGQDFTGGEFVMTEQRPRMQSRPMVLPLTQGDAAIISTAQRPFKGSKGYYRVNLKHAISRVRSGERRGLELFFHDTR